MLGSIRLGLARLICSWLGRARLRWTRVGLARVGWAKMDKTGTASLSHTGMGSERWGWLALAQVTWVCYVLDWLCCAGLENGLGSTGMAKFMLTPWVLCSACLKWNGLFCAGLLESPCLCWDPLKKYLRCWAWPDFSKKQLRWAVFGKTRVHRICLDWALLENAGVGYEGLDCAGPGRAVTRFNTVAPTPITALLFAV